MSRNDRIKLSPRLQMVADMVRPGVVAVDIGTDHAYIPVYLLQCGSCPRVIAADLRKGPLANAEATVKMNGLAGKISLRLSDGLDGIGADEAQDIILAGMGGILIAELLERVPWLRDCSKRLIIQPMTHAEDVRRFLLSNGFRIISEDACFEGNRCYVSVCAQYEGVLIKPESPAYYFIGELPACGNEAARETIKKIHQRLKKRADALERSSSAPEEVRELKEIMQEISEVNYDKPVYPGQAF